MFHLNMNPNKELISKKKLEKLTRKNILHGRTLVEAKIVYSDQGNPKVKYVIDKPVPKFYPYKYFLERTMMKNPKWWKSGGDLIRSELSVLSK